MENTNESQQPTTNSIQYQPQWIGKLKTEQQQQL